MVTLSSAWPRILAWRRMHLASAPSAWMEIELERDGPDVRVAARGSRNERPAPHLLGLDALPGAFAIAARNAAGRGRPLGSHLKTAKEMSLTIPRSVLGRADRVIQ